MFREMRRKGQQLPREEAIELLQSATSGVLAVHGDDGYPYAVPLSHFYSGGKLYFHCAKQGHKIDALRRCDKASFCVIAQDELHPERFTTYFRSVIAFGRVRVLESEAEKREAITALADRFAPGDPAGRDREINGSMPSLCVLEMTIEHLTGKEAKELMKRRG
ncbi:MAG: pyridoxamine 5'-phosphate oxidase family protein [Eubacteriales bacterium]|nr:pyridoxamine 5'-phosphate oxidase family protein [Eubacteriales bacterium]